MLKQGRLLFFCHILVLVLVVIIVTPLCGGLWLHVLHHPCKLCKPIACVNHATLMAACYSLSRKELPDQDQAARKSRNMHVQTHKASFDDVHLLSDEFGFWKPDPKRNNSSMSVDSQAMTSDLCMVFVDRTGLAMIHGISSRFLKRDGGCFQRPNPPG